jgi:hypothetical protein
MKVVVDADSFDELQLFLTGQIVGAIHRGLRAANLTPEQLEEAVSAAAFNVCCVIDGSTQMKLNDTQVVPVLTFADSGACESLTSCGGTSFMHEYVQGAAEDYFSEQD